MFGNVAMSEVLMTLVVLSPLILIIAWAMRSSLKQRRLLRDLEQRVSRLEAHKRPAD